MPARHDLAARAAALTAAGTPFVWATVVRAARPTSAKPGDSAIVNAVIDALHESHGVNHIDMPCTPARVWAAMQGRPEPPQ